MDNVIRKNTESINKIEFDIKSLKVDIEVLKVAIGKKSDACGEIIKNWKKRNIEGVLSPNDYLFNKTSIH